MLHIFSTKVVDYSKRVDGETFVSKRKVKKYVREHLSSHNKSDSKYVALMNQKQHIDVNLAYVSKKAISNYHIRLNVSIDCITLILH